MGIVGGAAVTAGEVAGFEGGAGGGADLPQPMSMTPTRELTHNLAATDWRWEARTIDVVL